MIDTANKKNTITSQTHLEKAVEQIGKIGRKISEVQAEMDADVAKAAKKHLRKLDRYKKQVAELDEQARSYCVENRDELLRGESGKTVKLPTGSIQFKQGRQSVKLTMDQDLVVARLQEAGYSEAIDVKTSVSKRVILANPEIVTKVPGITIEDGQETITIKPLTV